MTDGLKFRLDRIKTPIGALSIVTDERERLRAAEFEDSEERMLRLLRQHYGEAGMKVRGGKAPPELRARIDDYFGGAFAALDEIEVLPAGSDFQREVWAALRTIPAGSTLRYAELAQRVGRPSAVRAVGYANACNRVCVVVPDHRVVGADQELRGYSGGLERKRWLLEHEGALQPVAAKAGRRARGK